MRRLAQTLFLQFPVGAYLILAFGFGWAMWDDDQDDKRTDRALCAAAQQTRQEFRDFVVDSTETLEVPADATPDVQRIYEDANRLNAEFRDQQLTELPPIICKNGRPAPVTIRENEARSTTVTATTVTPQPPPQAPPVVRVIPVPGPVGPVGPVGPEGAPGPPGTVIVVSPPTTVQTTTTTRPPTSSTTGTTGTTSTTVASTTTTTVPATTSTTRPNLLCSLIRLLGATC